MEDKSTTDLFRGPTYSELCQCERCIEYYLYEEEDSEDELSELMEMLGCEEQIDHQLQQNEKDHKENPENEIVASKRKNMDEPTGFEPPDKKCKK